MLENLDSIDWANIHHSHGTAEEFPRWIRELRSDVEEIRERARDDLFEFSNHQGSIYEVTPYIVPFMIELLAAPDTPDKDQILYHLANLATGSRTMAKVSRYGGDEGATYENVKAGMDVYLSLLDDPSTAVRLAAFTVVTSMTVSVPGRNISARLMEKASQETDAGSLAEMIRMLQVYEQSSAFWGQRRGIPETSRKQFEALVSFFASLFASEHAPQVRFRAALAHLTLMGEAQREVAEVIAAILRDVLIHPEVYTRATSNFTIEWEVKQALKGLEVLPRARRLAILAEALAAARYAGDAHLIGRALLETLFIGSIRPQRPERSWVDSYQPHAFLSHTRLAEGDPAERPDNSSAPFRESTFNSGPEPRQVGWRYAASPPPADLGALSAEERRLLRLVLDTDLVWMVHSNLLEVYGLPVEREAVRALLDEADAAKAGQSQAGA